MATVQANLVAGFMRLGERVFNLIAPDATRARQWLGSGKNYAGRQ